MTQKVKIDFVISAQSQGVDNEIKRLRSQLNGLAASVKGPEAINKALREQMTLHEANINAIKGHAAAITTLNSASQNFTKRMQTGRVGVGELRNGFRVLTGTAAAFGSELDMVAKQQLKFQRSGFTKFMQDMNGKMTGVAHTTNSVVNATDMLRQQQMLAAKQMQAFGTQMVKQGKNMQWTGRQITMGFTLPFVLAGAAFATFAAEVDKELTRIVKVYDFAGDRTEEATNRVKENARTLATEISQAYGFAQQETLSVMAEFAQQGRRGQELLQMTGETMRTAFLGDVDTADASRLIRMLESAANIVNGINTGGMDDVIDGVENGTRSFEDLNEVLNRFNVLENETVITVADLAQELPDLVGTLNSLNLSVEFGAAALTAMKDSGLSVNESQTALRNSLQRLVSPTKKAQDVFRQFTGQDLNELTEGASSAEGVIMALADSLRGLEDFNQRADVLSAVFGNRQAGRLSLLFDQIGDSDSTFARAIGITGGFAGEEGVSKVEAYRVSLEETALVQESLSGKLERAKASFQGAAAALGDLLLPSLTGLVNVGTKIINFLDGLPEVLQKAIIAVPLVAGGFGLMVQIGGTLLNLFGSLTQAISFGVVKSMSMLGQETRIFATAEEALQHRMESSTQAMVEQQRQLTGLQRAMAQAQGYSFSGDVAGANAATLNAKSREQEYARQIASKRQSQKLLALESNALKEQYTLVRQNATEKERESKAQEKVLQSAREELEVLRKRNEYLQGGGRSKTGQFAADNKRLVAERELAKIKLQELETEKKIARAAGDNQLAKKKTHQIALQQLKVDQAILKVEQHNASGSKGGRDKAAAAVAAQELAVKKQQAKFDNASNAAEQAKLKLKREQLATDSKLSAISSKVGKNARGILTLEQLIAAKKQEQLALEREKSKLAQISLSRTDRELQQERKKVELARQQEMLDQKADRRRQRNSALAFGAMSVGYAVGGALDSDNIAGQAVNAGVSGLSAGMFMPGPPQLKLAVGLITALASFREPIMDGLRSLGLFSKELDSMTESARTFAEALDLPFNIQDVASQLGRGSFAGQVAFEQSDQGRRFMELYGEGGDREEFAVRDARSAALAMSLQGLTPEEIEEYIQPALDAAKLDIRFEDLIADNPEDYGRMVAQRMSDGIAGSSQSFSDALDMAFASLSAGNREYAAEAFGAILSEEFDNFGFDTSNVESYARSIREVGVEASTAADLAQTLAESLEQGNTDRSSLMIKLRSDLAFAPNDEARQAVQNQIDAVNQNLAFMETLFQASSTSARQFSTVLREVGEGLGLEPSDLAGISSIPDLMDRLAVGGTFAGEVSEIYSKKLQALINQQSALPPYARSSNEELQRQAFLYAIASEESGNFTNSLKELNEQQQEMFNSFWSEYKSEYDAVMDGLVEDLMAPIESSVEASMAAWDDMADAMSDRHDDQRDALRDSQDEQTRIFRNAQEERMDALDEALEAELDAFDEQTEAMEEAARASADSKIAALDAEEDAIAELDRQRERVFERERRRQEYFTSLRNNSLSLAVAVASGDVERAAELQGQMQADTSAYNNSFAEEELEQQREQDGKARDEKRDQIEAELELELERIEESRETERKALEETHQQRVAQLEEIQRLESKAMEDKFEAEQKLLQKRLENEREVLADQREAAQEVSREQLQGAEDVMNAIIKQYNPQTEADWLEVVGEINKKLMQEGYTDALGGGSLVDAISAAGVKGGNSIDSELRGAVNRAMAAVQNDMDWEELGATVADAIARGTFSDMPISGVEDLIGWINGGVNPFGGTNNQAGSGGSFAPGMHTGGRVQPGMSSSRQAGPLRAGERPIIAQDGEYMIQRSAVQQVGVPFLEAINNGRAGDGVRYHTGGLIGMTATSALLPFMGLVRAMGEAGGAALNQEGLSAFAGAFGRSPGGAASTGANALEAFMAVIREQESGGRYNVTNEIGAHGAYQFMPRTWAGAVGPALGRNVNLYNSSPAEQDAVARYLMKSYYDEMQSWQAVAASWYGGPGKGRLWVRNPNHSAFDAPQNGYPSIREYINSIVAKMGILPTTSGFGPFNDFSGGLAPPDHFAPWMNERQIGGVREDVMAVVGNVLSQIPGGQRIISGFRPGSIVKGTDRLSNHAYGKAVDIEALALSYPGGTRESDQMGDQIAAKFRALPREYGVSEVLWKTMTGGNHYNHVHVGFRNGVPAFNMPSMMTGGKVMYDNTIANLHAGETVLTKPLTEKLERGINNISNASTVNIYPSAGMDEERFANYVMQKLEARERLQGRRASV